MRPMLSPKHEPPAIAEIVRTTEPPTMWFSQRNIGAHAAKVPHEVPVAIERIAVTMRAVTAMSFAVIPRESAMLMISAATPVSMKHVATA